MTRVHIACPSVPSKHISRLRSQLPFWGLYLQHLDEVSPLEGRVRQREDCSCARCSHRVGTACTFDLMLRGQGGVAPAALRGNGGPLVCLALICMHDSPPTCPCLAFQGWVPVLWVFPFLARCWRCLLPVPGVPAAATEDCSRLRVVVDLPPEGGRSSADRWPAGSLDLQASGLSLVSPGGTDCQRQCQMPLCKQQGPWPLSVPVMGGQADRLFLTIMPAFLQCYCRLFVNPLQKPPGQAASPLPDRPTKPRSRTVRLGRVMSQGGVPSAGACDFYCAMDRGWPTWALLTTDHIRR